MARPVQLSMAVDSRTIGIEIGQQRVRRLRQRGGERVRESRWKLPRAGAAVGRSAAYEEQLIHRGTPRGCASRVATVRTEGG